MGYQIRVKCGCQDKSIMLGVGMLYPAVNQHVSNAIRAGEYGEKMKILADSTELITVDASCKAYRCDECGHIESALCLDLYKSTDIESTKKTVVGRWSIGDDREEKTVGELGEWPYWTPDVCGNKDGNYVLLKRYEHNCPSCKKAMALLNTSKIRNMRCPRCKKKYDDGGKTMALWD